MVTHKQDTPLGNPPALLAIVQAARQIGDSALERAARRELADRYGIELVFRRDNRRQEAGHAD